MKRKSKLPIELSMIIAVLCLAFSIMGCGEPAFESLDGSFIAFVRNDQIWTANADGTEQKQLTQGWDAAPAVSPDGKTIVYLHREGDRPDSDRSDTVIGNAIYVIPSTGGNPTRLTPGSWLTDSGWVPIFPEKVRGAVRRYCKYPSFSPDGKSICFVISDVGSPEDFQAVASINYDGAAEPKVLYKHNVGFHEGPTITYPRFSPDGNVIFFYLGAVLRRLPANGGNPSGVAGGANAKFGRGYSIDNSNGTIASHQWTQDPDDSQAQIVLMNLNKTDTRIGNRRTLYTAPKDPSRAFPNIIQDSSPPSFSSSGKTIAFSGNFKPKYAPMGRRKTYLIPTGGGKPKEVIYDSSQPCFGRKLSGQ